MNYQSEPDIRPDVELTASAVALFQRFRQEVDIATLSRKLEEELRRHRRLCDLAILNAAHATFYWCELPTHPISDVAVLVQRQLEEDGFLIEHHQTVVERSGALENHPGKNTTVQLLRSYATASWLRPTKSDENVAAEWQRREELEDRVLSANPPVRCSTGTGPTLDTGSAVWAASDKDDGFVVEVQRIYQRYYLCLFDVAGACVHYEPTTAAYGAVFGPDVGDVASWSERAERILEERIL